MNIHKDNQLSMACVDKLHAAKAMTKYIAYHKT